MPYFLIPLLAVFFWGDGHVEDICQFPDLCGVPNPGLIMNERGKTFCPTVLGGFLTKILLLYLLNRSCLIEYMLCLPVVEEILSL